MENIKWGKGFIKAETNYPPNIRNLTKDDYYAALKRLNIDFMTPIVTVLNELEGHEILEKTSVVNFNIDNPTELEKHILDTVISLRKFFTDD